MLFGSGAPNVFVVLILVLVEGGRRANGLNMFGHKLGEVAKPITCGQGLPICSSNDIHHVTQELPGSSLSTTIKYLEL